MSNNGYIQLSRRFFQHQFWNNKREYSRAEAFLDLIQNANYAPNKVMIGNVTIDLGRGQQVASLRFLGERWKWSPAKVNRFMAVLKAEQMVKQETKQGQTVLTLCNYETYNSPKNKSETASETESETGAKQERNRSETKQKKVIRKEGKTTTSAKADAEAIWGLFPAMARTRSSKLELEQALAKHKDRPQVEVLAKSVTEWANCHEWTKEGGQFAPGAHRWASKRKWEQKPEGTQTTKTKSVNERPLFD